MPVASPGHQRLALFLGCKLPYFTFSSLSGLWLELETSVCMGMLESDGDESDGDEAIWGAPGFLSFPRVLGKAAFDV